MRTLRRKLWRDIGERRTQFLAVAVTVFLGITLFAASYDSFQNLVTSYHRTAVVSRFANLTVTGGDTSGFAGSAAGEPGVEYVETRTQVDLPLQLPGTRLLGRVVGLPGAPNEVNRLTVVEGGLPGPGEVAAEKHLADHFSLHAGSTIDVLGANGWTTMRVSGVVASPEYIWPAKSRQEVLTTPDNFGVVFTPQATAETLTGTAPNQVVVYYQGGNPDPALTDRLTAAATGAVDVYTRADQPSNSALEEDLAGFEELALFFPILFLSAAAMAGYVMITRLVHAQRPQIGLMTANGFGRRQILAHYLGYGLAPGIAGAVPGAVAGTLLARVITELYTRMLSVPVTVIEIHPTTIVIALVLGIAVSVVAAFGPARRAAGQPPAESMRGAIPNTGGRPSIVERFLPQGRRLPIRWRMGLRGIERNPRRTISTGLGVVLSLVLVLVSWGMLDTIQLLMRHQFGEVDRQDAQVFFTSPVDTATVSHIADVAGVAKVEPILQVPASVGPADALTSTALVALPTDTTLHGFYDPKGGRLALPDHGALVAQSLVDAVGASVGDTMVLNVTGFGTVDVEVAGVVDEPLGSFVYVSLDQVRVLAGGQVPITSALVAFDPGASATQIKDRLLADPGVAAFEASAAIADTMRSFMGLFYGFVGVMLLFGAAMAFALISNAMTVNIAERTREVGTLLAVGVERRTISRLITVENLVIAAIGIPLGVIAGYYTSVAAMNSFQSDMFRLALHMRWTTPVLSAVAILVVALVSQRPGLAAIKRMDIARIVKDRTS